MDTFRKGGDEARAGGPAPKGAGAAPSADLSSILNYPSLGQLFDSTDPRPLEEMRARLARTNEGLERVVRQGPKDEAERAARASRAVNVTLKFLDDLEQLRREQAAKKT